MAIEELTAFTLVCDTCDASSGLSAETRADAYDIGIECGWRPGRDGWACEDCAAIDDEAAGE